MEPAGTDRDYSLDVIRITAMFAVCVLHVARMGGFLQLHLHEHIGGKLISNLMEAPCIMAVDLFALLSGYLLIDGKWRIKKIYALLFQVLSYFILPFVLFGVRTSYWYVNAYVVLFLIMPWVKRGLRNLSRRSYLSLLVVCFIGFSLLGSCCNNQITQNGHNTLWLAVMFAFGGYIKRFHVTGRRLCFFLGWLVSSLGLFGVLMLEADALEAALFRHYQSPLILVNSVCLFILLKDVKVRGKFMRHGVEWCSPLAFGVYLFHCNFYVWSRISYHLSRFAVAHDYAWWIIPLVAVLIFISGILLDFCRLKLFALLRISALVDLLYKFTPSFLKDLEVEGQLEKIK